MPKTDDDDDIKVVRHSCWYCGKECRQDIVGSTFFSSDHGGIRLLSGDYAHQDCHNQVKPGPAYKSAKASYQAWMRRNDKKVMKYLNDPCIKVSITYFGDNSNGK